MWRFNLTDPTLCLKQNGEVSISFACRKQEVFYQTDARFTQNVGRAVEQGMAIVEIHRKSSEVIGQILQMSGHAKLPNGKIGTITFHSESSPTQWEISCLCGVDETKFDWIENICKLKLSSPRELGFVFEVDFLGFKSPKSESEYPDPIEFENGAPYFFESISFTVYEVTA